MDWCFSWLYTPRNDGKPRMLISYEKFHKSTDCADFIESIKEAYFILKIENMPEVILNILQDFKRAYNPVCFFINTSIHWYETVENISIDNVKTNEKLVIKTKSVGSWKKLMISRYPLNAAKSWVESYEKEITEWDTNHKDLCRKINMDRELTIAM
jgi:hypothetical protein